MSGRNGWIGVDLDGTLAQYGTWVDASHVGEPVPAMLDMVKGFLDEGCEVRVFTARVYPINDCVFPDTSLAQLRMDRLPHLTPQETGRWADAITAVEAVRAWTRKHLGRVLAVTNVKDYSMVMLYDDRCVQVLPNTGKLVLGPGARK